MITHSVQDMNDREKKLLTALEKYPDLPMKELANHISYKRASTIVRKVEQLREQHMIWGPFYDINYGKLCKNPFHKLFCIFESNKSYNTVLSYLRLIESLVWSIPVLSPHREIINAGFYFSNSQEIRALFQMLKDNGIITGYETRVFCRKRIIENPDFFGDINPPLDNLLSPCDIPDLSFESHDTNWSECDIAVLPHLMKGARLIDILRAERKLQKSWTYEQIKYSFRKMIKNRLIEKKYHVFPFHPLRCNIFNLFLKTEHIDLTKRIVYNFARGGRLYREYSLCDDWGFVNCVCHPSFLVDLMYKLDHVDAIEMKEIHHIRSISGNRPLNFPPEVKYYDVETQTLEYPYHVYREKIEEKLGNDQNLQI